MTGYIVLMTCGNQAYYLGGDFEWHLKDPGSKPRVHRREALLNGGRWTVHNPSICGVAHDEASGNITLTVDPVKYLEFIRANRIASAAV